MWESTTGSLKSQGWILLQPQNGGSLITVHLEYHPPAGAIEAMFTRLFKDPQKMLEGNLEKLQRIIVTDSLGP